MSKLITLAEEQLLAPGRNTDPANLLLISIARSLERIAAAEEAMIEIARKPVTLDSILGLKPTENDHEAG